MFASAANYLANVLLGRQLEARAFADAAMVVSGMLLLSAVALGLQLTVARCICTGDDADAVRRLQHRARLVGGAVGVAVIVTAPAIAAIFEMESAVPIALLGVGVPVFFALAVRRGMLQASQRFGRLAVSQFVEPVTRLAVTAVALSAGLGTSSAAVGLMVAFGAGWVVSRPNGAPAMIASRGGSAARTAIAATVLLLVGQVVIANGDLWVVSAMRPDDAGLYAAVALIGRLVYVAAWSIVMVLFPTLVSGASGARNELLRRGLVGTAVVGGALSAIAFATGDRLVVGMVGDEFQGSGSLLGPYALATTLFVMSNLIAVADLAAGRRRVPAVMAAGALFQTAVLIPLALGGIHLVVLGQLAVMAVLFAVSTQLSVARRRRSSLTTRAAALAS
jgi:O-antigen/teichoic acid export membrane protein